MFRIAAAAKAVNSGLVRGSGIYACPAEVASMPLAMPERQQVENQASLGASSSSLSSHVCLK